LGIAFSLKTGGVIAPAILETNRMSLEDFNSSFKDLAFRSKSSQLKSRELTEGTVTITNLGEMGCDEVFGIVFPPQVCLIGIGHIRKVPIVGPEDSIQVGLVADFTLSADHRVTDGLLGSLFLLEIEKNLNSPLSF
jgi:pyruvate dehydrogenase E2 component (dihydrolipoamide acetyltransferase)